MTYNDFWKEAIDLRSVILKQIEEKRKSSEVKHSLDSSVVIELTPKVFLMWSAFESFHPQSPQTFKEFMKELCIVSSFEVVFKEKVGKESN